MNLKLYFSRILHDRVKLAIAIILFSIPILEVGQIVWSAYQGHGIPRPHYATFLCLYTLRHYLQKIMFWFLPLFLLVIVNEDTIEDYETGYRNALISRAGRKNYARTKLVGSFSFSFLIVFLSLIINMILIYACFQNGTYEMYDWQGIDYRDRDISRITMPHPVLANIAYIILTSFLAGLVGMMGTAVALTMQNRKIVYALTFFLWFVPVNLRYSILFAIKPFSYGDFEIVVPTLITVIIGYLLIAMVSYWLEVHDDKV